MAETNMLDLIKEGIFLKISAKSSDDFFEQTSDILLAKGYVKDSFLKAIKKREYEYPTGLSTEEFDIAMPHVEAEHILKNSICVVNLDPPVPFRRMDKPEQILNAKLAFMMLICNPKIHTKAISELVNIFMSPKSLEDILKAESKDDVISAINKVVKGKEVQR